MLRDGLGLRHWCAPTKPLVGWSPTPPHPTFLTFELGQLHPTISATFQNQQSDIHAHFLQQLSRCVELLSVALFFNSLHILSFAVPFYVHNRVQNTVCPNVLSPYLYNTTSLHDGRLFIPPSIVAFRNNYKYMSCELVLFEPTPALSILCPDLG